MQIGANGEVGAQLPAQGAKLEPAVEKYLERS
jgi:hypothetical protein